MRAPFRSPGFSQPLMSLPRLSVHLFIHPHANDFVSRSTLRFHDPCRGQTNLRDTRRGTCFRRRTTGQRSRVCLDFHLRLNRSLTAFRRRPIARSGSFAIASSHPKSPRARLLSFGEKIVAQHIAAIVLPQMVSVFGLMPCPCYARRAKISWRCRRR